jgi:glutamyl-tRNA reductase
MTLVTVGLNHKTAPLEFREKLSFSPEAVKKALHQFSEASYTEECLILSTCNRVEVYGASSHPAQAAEEIKRFLSEFHEIPLSDLNPHLYSRQCEEAIRHGFRVASGLDSMVLGESQILGQMKEAYRLAGESGCVGPLLNRYLHRVFRVAKRVRTETEIGNFPVSVSYVAVTLAKKIFGSLKGRKALLLGAGKMSELAAKHLKSQGSPEIWVANRNFEKAEAMARACEGMAVHFNDFLLSLPQVDVVITSTSSEDYLLKSDQIHEAMRLRKNRPMFIIDIAVPRNVDPEINRIFNVYLYDLDDLKTVVQSHQRERESEAEKAEVLIQEETTSFLKSLDTLSVAPTIQRLSKKFETIRQREVEKALLKLKDLSPEQIKVLEAMAASIVNKILHEPLLALKSEFPDASDGKSSNYSDLLQKLFRLDEVIE